MNDLNTVVTLSGPFTDAHLALLFVDNSAPTQADIEAATRDAKLYGDAADRLMRTHGVLKGVYIRNQPVYGPIVRLMALAGWTVSGSGFFSVAFFKGGLAIKLGLRPKTDAALGYLHWCKDNADLAGVPTLYAMGEYEDAYVVLMDRYDPICGELDEGCVLYDPNLAMEYESLKEAINAGETSGWHTPFPTTQTAHMIRREFAGQGYFDIKSDNVMLDRNGGLIITDPIGSTGNLDSDDSSYSYSIAA